MLKFLNKPYNFILSIMFLAVIAIVAGNVFAGGGQPGWQGTSGTPANFYLEVAKGNIPGHSIIHKFGHGTVATTVVPVTGSLKYETPTAAVALEIVSADAADALDDVGAREYTVIGIDANYDEVTQVIAAHATTGLTAVAIPTSLLRIYRWYVSSSGTYATDGAGSHVGALTIRVSGGGATWSTIEATDFPDAQSEIACFTIPDGFRGYLLSTEVKFDTSKIVSIFLFKRTGIDDVATPFSPMRMIGHSVGVSGIGGDSRPLVPLNSFPARTDMGFMAMVSTGTADVSINFELLLIADGY